MDYCCQSLEYCIFALGSSILSLAGAIVAIIKAKNVEKKACLLEEKQKKG